MCKPSVNLCPWEDEFHHLNLQTMKHIPVNHESAAASRNKILQNLQSILREPFKPHNFIFSYF